MKPTDQSHLFATAVSDQGMQRKNNEDRYGVSTYLAGQIPSLLAMVCDGIGGHLAGEVAAELAVATITSVVGGSDAASPQDILSQAVLSASQAVRSEAQKEAERRGMGATCVVAWVIGSRLYTTSLGDSPLFLVRSGAIQRITTPHTWVQEAVEAGVLTPEAARNHPNAHVIRRYLGMADPVLLDFRLRLVDSETDEQAIANQGMELQPGDILLLCSDGLTDMVEEADILSTLLEKGCNPGVFALRDLANAHGGMDNITIVAVEMPRSEQKTVLSGNTVPIKRPTPAPRPKSLLQTLLESKLAWLGCSLVVLLTIALVSVVLFWSVFTGRLDPRPSATPTASATASSTAAPTLPQPAVSTALPTSPSAPTLTARPVGPGQPTPTYTPWPTSSTP